MTPEPWETVSPEVWEKAVEERRQQGLPEHVEDPAILDLIASLMVEDMETPTPTRRRREAS